MALVVGFIDRVRFEHKPSADDFLVKFR